MLEGNVKFPGHYHECRLAKNEDFEGKYCLSYYGIWYLVSKKIIRYRKSLRYDVASLLTRYILQWESDSCCSHLITNLMTSKSLLFVPPIVIRTAHPKGAPATSKGSGIEPETF